MSGHSKWSTIKRQKGANDAKRGAMFTKLSNAIALAAKKGGGDPTMNATLALAIEKAKAVNMPNTNIERSIKRGTGELGGAVVEEVMYEGYGPGGVAVLVEGATDNKNRTIADVRTAFTKNGGNLAAAGSVVYLFERKGLVRAKKGPDADEDQLLAIDAGADDIFDDGDVWVVYCEASKLNEVRSKLKETGLDVESAELAFVPKETVEITDETIQNKVMNLMDGLDDLDDVVETHTNFDVG